MLFFKKSMPPTFHDSPRCLPPQNPFAIHLIFFVTADHSEGHRLLWTDIYFNTVHCTEESRTRFIRRSKSTTFAQSSEWGWESQSGSSWERLSLLTRRKNLGTTAWVRKNRTTYSDLVIVTLVLHVLIKLFLWVKLDPAHLQLLFHLQQNTEQTN